jgi:hypothetical protein
MTEGMVNDGGGQIQLQRQKAAAVQPVQQAQQQGGGRQETLKEGQIDMDEGEIGANEELELSCP